MGGLERSRSFKGRRRTRPRPPKSAPRRARDGPRAPPGVPRRAGERPRRRPDRSQAAPVCFSSGILPPQLVGSAFATIFRPPGAAKTAVFAAFPPYERGITAFGVRLRKQLENTGVSASKIGPGSHQDARNRARQAFGDRKVAREHAK